ncbi:MAG TPA: DUF2817 domain-containing protein [Acidimicrobiia bacterium]|nr:DUF2817 domain-containing protein [Acidimicrobiia bacterium]
MADGLRLARLPLTYDECRARFRWAAAATSATAESHVIGACGPEGQRLSIDIVRLGAEDAPNVLVVLSGVHGVEGFLGSTLQTDAMLRWSERLGSDVAALFVHAVNPWGMAWGRRQNETNVDLNRNWRRDEGTPFDNAGYDEVHALACPDSPDLPDPDAMMADAMSLVAERGLPWVRDAITVGQYRHADGLHYGGAQTEASNRVLEEALLPKLRRARRVLILDLHTGHGPRGEVTILSDQPPSSAQHEFFTAIFDRVEATVDNPDATTGKKAGQIANGLRDELANARCFSTALEFGTASDIEQLQATYQEQWVFRRGDRTHPAHQAAIAAYRNCFTPDDEAWERQTIAAGRAHLDRALSAVETWA